MRLSLVAAALVVALPIIAEAEQRPQDAVVARLSPVAKDYLQEAIKAFRDEHIYAAKIDWDAVTSKAYALVPNAQTPSDTYPAIRLIIHELGEKHTGFVEANQVVANKTGQHSGSASPPALALPEGLELVGGIGVLRLFAFTGSTEQGYAYSGAAKTILNKFHDHKICRIIVDLRLNGGGNMWPMLNGLTSLFSDGVLGFFESRSGEKSAWLRERGGIFEGPVPAATVRNHLTKSSQPVSVLIGGNTASSGEFTAMAFKGRPNTRFFGVSSAGLVSANRPINLSDGAQIIMTTGWGSDRTGRKYVDALVPDETTGSGGPTMDAAITWLNTKKCKVGA